MAKPVRPGMKTTQRMSKATEPKNRVGLHSRTPSGPAVTSTARKGRRQDCTRPNAPKHRDPTCNAGAIQTGHRWWSIAEQSLQFRLEVILLKNSDLGVARNFACPLNHIAHHRHEGIAADAKDLAQEPRSAFAPAPNEIAPLQIQIDENQA